MKRSLLDCISGALTPEGVLPHDFSLPRETDERGMRFADGALDGIYLYHMQHAPVSAEDIARLGELTALAGAERFDEAEEGFKAFLKEHSAISIIDDLQRNIAANQGTLSPNAIYKFAVRMLMESDDAECVKVGLGLTEFFDAYEIPELAAAIRTAGLSDEFTLYAVFNIRNWPNAQDELLALAQKVRGWGRIHCVDYIEATKPATKKWLLLSGVDNDVVPAYSALTVYEKAEVSSLLNRQLFSEEEVHALLALTDALLDEGPVAGISRVDSPDVFLKRIIEIAAGKAYLDEYERDLIEKIKNR